VLLLEVFLDAFAHAFHNHDHAKSKCWYESVYAP